ncbi:hypothetical protein GGQ99_005061 [Aminobacter niigataensis]|uniref:Transposase n=1 Tax=Aminobacter niigataensis TaxID=83265 RepID=A0ABR6L8Y1_9HYPH|nr:hypothetical protein [Aminobacter niigataensis]
MTSWEIEVRKNGEVYLLVAADSLRKCARFLVRYLFERRKRA